MKWIYASTACRAAVKAGDESRPEELQRLAERILVNKDIRTCPHGRPVCFEITRKELGKAVRPPCVEKKQKPPPHK